MSGMMSSGNTRVVAGVLFAVAAAVPPLTGAYSLRDLDTLLLHVAPATIIAVLLGPTLHAYAVSVRALWLVPYGAFWGMVVTTVAFGLGAAASLVMVVFEGPSEALLEPSSTLSDVFGAVGLVGAIGAALFLLPALPYGALAGVIFYCLCRLDGSLRQQREAA